MASFGRPFSFVPTVRARPPVADPQASKPRWTRALMVDVRPAGPGSATLAVIARRGATPLENRLSQGDGHAASEGCDAEISNFNAPRAGVRAIESPPGRCGMARVTCGSSRSPPRGRPGPCPVSPAPRRLRRNLVKHRPQALKIPPSPFVRWRVPRNLRSGN